MTYTPGHGGNKLPYSEKEQHLIDILHEHAPGLSYKGIADELNYFFAEYNKGTRKRKGVIGYLDRKKKE
jgi:hypothetical protein